MYHARRISNEGLRKSLVLVVCMGLRQEEVTNLASSKIEVIARKWWVINYLSFIKLKTDFSLTCRPQSLFCMFTLKQKLILCENFILSPINTITMASQTPTMQFSIFTLLMTVVPLIPYLLYHLLWYLYILNKSMMFNELKQLRQWNYKELYSPFEKQDKLPETKWSIWDL